MIRDEVDRLVLDWRRERPDLELDDLHILSRISRLARRLELARRDAWRALQLESWEFDVLAALRRAGPPYELSPGALLKATLVSSGTMTNRLDRLVERRLVTRRTHPDDGRQVLIRLTAAGRERVDAAFETLLACERELLAPLPPDQQDALAATLRRLLVSLADR